MWPKTRLSASARDYLKVAALALMVIDHLGGFIVGLTLGAQDTVPYHLLRGVGRLSMPIFAALLIESARTTEDPSKLKRRGVTIFEFALLAQLLFEVAVLLHPKAAFRFHELNILFTFSLAYALKAVWNERGQPPVSLIFAGALISCFIEYGPGLLLFCLAFSLTEKQVSKENQNLALWIGFAGLVTSTHFDKPQWLGLIGLAIVVIVARAVTGSRRISVLKRVRHFSLWFYTIHVPVIIISGAGFLYLSHRT